MKKTITFFSTRAAMMLLATLLLTLTAQTAWADTGYNYKGADGTMRNTSDDGIPDPDVTVLTNESSLSSLEEGWYYVSGNVNLTNSIDFMTPAQADREYNFHLILADGASLTINCNYSYCIGIGESGNLNIYGQTQGTGTLNVTSQSTYAIDGFNGSSITLIGGIVNATAVDDWYDGIHADNIYLAGAIVTASKYSGIVSASCKYKDSDNNEYEGSIEPSTIAGKTLNPVGTVIVASTSVTLNQQSGSSGTESVTASYGAAMPTITPPTRTGYTFGGYYDGMDGVGTKYYNADGTSAHAWNYTCESFDLFAKWIANTYTVHLDQQGGGEGTTSVTATYGAAMPSATMPTREGYTFGGYFTEEGGRGTKYYNADGSSAHVWDIASNDEYLYAMWTTDRINMNVFFIHSGTDVNAGSLEDYENNGLSVTINGQSVFRSGNFYPAISLAGQKNTISVTLPYFLLASSATYDYSDSGDHPVNDNPMTYEGGNYTWSFTIADNAISPQDRNVTIKINIGDASGRYTVFFDPNGGTGTMMYLIMEEGSRTLPTCNFTRDGYTFLGWATSADGPVAYLDGAEITAPQSQYATQTLYAKWSNNSAPVNTYTVTFNANGGTGEMGPQTFTVDEAQNLSTCTFTREGYTFDGWATTQNGDVAYTDGQSVSNLASAGGMRTLYAHWTPIHIVTSEMRDWAAGTYNVTGNVTTDGGVTITGDVILNINSGCTLTIDYIHADQGSLTFNGPGTLSVADEIMANSFNMTGGTINANSISIAGSISGGAINVVNYFEAGSCTIVGGNDHYDDLTISGGTIETGTLVIASLVIDATNSHSISIKANEYRFDNSGSLTINGTLYAGTTPLTGTLNSGISAYNGMYLRTSSYSNTYTVNFNANGGSGTMSPQTFTVGVAQNLSTCTFTRNDHTFDGWATSQGGNVAYTDEQSVSNLTSAGGTVTLYAHWTENAAPVTTYTVAFDGNGSTYGTMAAQTFTVGVAQNLSNCNFSRHGYTFDGWATAPDGNKVYDNGESVSNLASAGETTTLYAHWTPNTYTVIFDKNGGSGNQMDNQAFTYDMAQELSECTYTKDGYTFDGWATADDGNVVYTDKQSVSNLTAVANGTVTLYAHWAQDIIYTEGTYHLNNTNISGDIICKGDVTLIVDGELTVSGIRKEGEGFLTINVQDHSSITAGSIDANNLNMNGGSITVGSINVDNFNMTGGTVSVGSLTASGGDISDGTLSITGDFYTYYNTISGGNITVGGKLQINGNLQYKANQATMSIYAKEYNLVNGSLSITSERGFSDGTTAYNGNSTIASPAALNGQTLKPAYKVTIEENGGSEVEDQFVAYGSTISDPGSTKTGYTATWKEGGVEYDFTAAVTEDFTLTADWTAKTYTVTLDRQDGDGGTTEVIATYDADMPAITIPTMLGYTFDGYFTETDGGGIQYYDADGTSTRTWDIDATTATTLYAKWEILRFEIDDVTYEWTREMNVKVTGYNGALASITILPSVEHNGVSYNVTEIGEGAFEGNTVLDVINTYNSIITVIRARAFMNCSNLSKIDGIHANLTTIEAEAFSGSGLTEFTFPECLTTIQDNAFSNCGRLTIDLSDIPTSVTSIGTNAFNNVHLTATLTDTESGNALERLSSVFDGYDVEANFTRGFSNGVASTVCLPFDFTPTGGTYYTFDSVDENWTTVTMKTAEPDNRATTDDNGHLQANTPYLFMPAATGEQPFSGTVTCGSTTADVTTVGDWTFTGTYEEKRWDVNDNNTERRIFGFATGQGYEGTAASTAAGEFIRLNSGGIKPFRAYLEYNGSLQARTRGEGGLPETMTVRLVNANGEIQGIGEIRLDTGEVTFDSRAWYDLNGRRLDGKPSEKGIYINGGRKVVIK